MIASLIRFLKGYVTIGISGSSPERFINLCGFHKLYVWGLKPSGKTYIMNMGLKDFRKIHPLVRKTHVKVGIIRKVGLPFFMHRHRKRKAFFAGAFLCVLIIQFLSDHIWDIHFEGNDKWTEDVLMDFLKDQDVEPSMSRKQVDCTKIAKDIRKEYDDIVWVSASLDGCVLKIHIKENDDTFKEKKKSDDSPKDLVAVKDGIVTNIITRKGIPCVHVGDKVSKGDILVSGKIEIMNDAQEVTGYRYLRADADVFADTKMNYVDTIDKSDRQKDYQNNIRCMFYMKMGDYLFKTGSLKHHFAEWDAISNEKKLKIGENFKLPFSMGYQVIRPYTSKEYMRSTKELQEELSVNYNLFSKELKEKGVQIRKKDVKIHMYDTKASARGVLYLNEKITKEADTKIIEIKEEDLDESGRIDD